MAKPKKIDKEIEEYRMSMQPPSTFEDGFNWVTLVASIFVGLMMVPGTVYMGLVIGQGMGDAARWVTAILFIEVARRAQKNLKNAEVFVLFFMVSAAMAMPFQGLLFNQFFARSDAAAAYGIAKLLPKWYAPAPDSESYLLRTFLHVDWLPVIGLILFGTIMSRFSTTILGYGFFRMASDVEGLPFPMAPIGAQGVLALAEDPDERKSDKEERSWRWRVFSIGGALGLAFGAVYSLLPILSGAWLSAPIQIIPIPWVDWTQKTARFLPACGTGIQLELGLFLVGTVMPFWGVVGSAIGVVATFIMNPLLYKFEILRSWAPGDNTIVTSFKNNMDFYFSFGIGISVAIAFAGFFQAFKSILQARKDRKEGLGPKVLSREYLKQRGDIPVWAIVLCYFVVTISYILLAGYLIDWHKGVMVVLLFFGFVYTPFISYVTARLEGLIGQSVEVPMLRQACFILSGYEGVAVWFLPVPQANYGASETIFYRQCELTGTKFMSIWKTELILTPIIIVSSILYMSYIWSLAEVPSAVYPFAQQMWDLNAANSCIMYSSTIGEYSIFEEAFRWSYMLWGAGVGGAIFWILSIFGAPIFLIYGLVQGLNQLPHGMILTFAGALVGRYYLRKRLGDKYLQVMPVVVAGFGCGMGLIGTVGVGITFLAKSVIALPF